MIDIKHAMNVSRLSQDIGKRFELPERELAVLSVGALFHDIGKSGLPQELLDKPSALTPDEYKIIQWHTTLGALTLQSMPDEIHRAAAQVALYHHERLDGSGYLGLSKEGIPLAARIVAVADVYDALVTNRPYRPAWKKNDALIYIKQHAGSAFDPSIVDVLLEIEKED